LKKGLTNPKKCDIINTSRGEDKAMLQKNKAKEERKAKRKPPIPYTRRTPTKQETLEKNRKKFQKPLDKIENL
jgi:hypothetical protein